MLFQDQQVAQDNKVYLPRKIKHLKSVHHLKRTQLNIQFLAQLATLLVIYLKIQTKACLVILPKIISSRRFKLRQIYWRQVISSRLKQVSLVKQVYFNQIKIYLKSIKLPRKRTILIKRVYFNHKHRLILQQINLILTKKKILMNHLNLNGRIMILIVIL